MDWEFFFDEWTATSRKDKVFAKYSITHSTYFWLFFVHATRADECSQQRFYLGAFRKIEDAKQQAELFDNDPVKNPAKIAFPANCISK